MTIEATPVGMTCNINCSYCYQTPMRDADPRLPMIDIAAMKRALLANGPQTVATVARRGTGQAGFTMFGGEPLLAPLAVLEDLWSWGLAQFGANAIQTNGSLITPVHLEMFTRLKVAVGISIDGPGELNDARWGGSLEKTREMTARSERAIDTLVQAGIVPSLIVTLSRQNASADKLDMFIRWFIALRGLGIRHVNLHFLEVDHTLVQQHLALSSAELLAALRRCAQMGEAIGLRFSPLTEIPRLLVGDDDTVSCVWHACDPYTTRAVQGVGSLGQRSNCGRTNTDGIPWQKAPVEGYERQLALYATPYEDGGCKDCRFFLMCKGQCPGTAIDGDWRNRTEHCETYLALFEDEEARIVASGRTPLSLTPFRFSLEQAYLAQLAMGHNPTLAALQRGQQAPVPSVHGDVPHGDSHGDHTDVA